MIEILKKSLQESCACPFVRAHCLACDYVQLNNIQMLLAVFDPRRDFFKFPYGLCLRKVRKCKHCATFWSPPIRKSCPSSAGVAWIQRDWHAHGLPFNCSFLFLFVLFLCISFRSLTRCDETDQVWHPPGPKKLKQCSLMGEAAVIHSLWILIKFSLSVSVVFLFPAEMASTHQGPARYIYRLVSIRGTYCRNEVWLNA